MRPSSLSSYHDDIWIPNNIQEVSGIINFWSTELRESLDVSKGCESLYPEVVEDYGFL